MSSLTSCSDPHHNQLPRYPSITKAMQTSTSVWIQYTPKGPMLVSLVKSVVLSTFALIGAIAFFPATTAGAVSAFFIWNGYKTISCINCIKAQKKLEGVIPPREFIVSENGFVSCPLTEEEFNLIKPYCFFEWSQYTQTPLEYPINIETHYQVSGGELGTWSIKPPVLKQVCTKTNRQQILDKYTRWINHLIALVTHKNKDKIPKEFLNLVGKICKRSNTDDTYQGTNYTFKYNAKNACIQCTHNTKERIFILNTPEDCLKFVQEEYLESGLETAWRCAKAWYNS